ncbi:MAG: SpoIID/LytB domain-containing protein [Odoribacter sp.]|nr:SpoIID/LytB domain-containing protein [Odoribacter sp.]
MAMLKEEPIVRVGIVTAPEINVKFLGSGRAKFEIADVTIGKDFHWERRQSQRFGGKLEMRRNNDCTLTAINHIGVEEYLTSVIGSEMNRESSLELLKAHAVISRSWLLAQIRRDLRYPGIACADTEGRIDRGDVTVDWQDREDHEDFDVCADDHCQRYQGIGDAEIPLNVYEAMSITRGEVLTYDGMICDTRFSKCCGGKTEDFATCWEPNHHPYLTPVDDPYCAEATPELLAKSLNGYDIEDRDTYRWHVEYTARQLEMLLKRRSGIDFGEIQELNALKRGESGRIYLLEIIGSKARKAIGKELIIRRWLSKTHLKSSAFEAKRLPGGDWRLEGRGWGHGVGLCQIGAAVMAEKGMTYREILNHYYPGSTIEKLY